MRRLVWIHAGRKHIMLVCRDAAHMFILYISQKSVYGGPAWKNDSMRNKAYLHQFTPEMPDLNLRSAVVLQELQV
jgi:glycosidase